MAIEKLKSKGKVVAYRSNVYHKGKRYIGQRTQSKTQAELDELETKRNLITGNNVEATHKTLKNGFDDYMSLVAPKRLGLTALKGAESYFRNHIEPVFGFREMTSIKSIEIQKFLVQKEQELSNATVIKMYTLINQIYKMMIQWDELESNPLDGVEKPSANHKAKITWTKDECHKFLSVAQEHQSFIAFWLALQFGLRLSEVLGLQWKNIDFDNNILHVEQAYHESENRLGRLKTDSSRRSIPMSEQQATFLIQYKQDQSSKSDIVAANSNGGFLMKRNIRRAMQNICNRAGVTQITFHELRHTHATLMLEMNEHVKIVQQRLGHVKAETTVNIYSHVRPQVHQDSAERFSAFFNE